MQENFLERFLARKNYEESTFDPEYDMLEKLESVECCWSKYVKIGDKYYWKINETFPNVLIDTNMRKLPSDSVYRKDIIHWNLKH